MQHRSREGVCVRVCMCVGVFSLSVWLSACNLIMVGSTKERHGKETGEGDERDKVFSPIKGRK